MSFRPLSRELNRVMICAPRSQLRRLDFPWGTPVFPVLVVVLFAAMSLPQPVLARHDNSIACTDPVWVPSGTTWSSRTFVFDIKESSIPGTNGPRIRRIRDGANTWNRTSSSCHYADQANFFIDFRGDTSRPASDHRDNINAVDFGPSFCTKKTFLACTTTRFSDRTRIVETDLHFVNRYKFYSGVRTHVPCGNYDLWAVAAHEFGHAIGLSHTTTRPRFLQTMHFASVVTKCNTGAPGIAPAVQRTLGRSDTRGLRRLYPGL